MFNRPTLPPLGDLLRLPEAGTYLREAPQFNHRITSSINQNAAQRPSEKRTLRVARQQTRQTSHLMKVRTVQPSPTNQAGWAS